MEKYNVEEFEDLTALEEFNLILEDDCTIFAKELEEEIKKSRAHNKRIEYYSDKVIIYSYKKNLNLGQDVLVFETIYRNREGKKGELSYIANKKMYGSHLLYLINRAELKSK